MPEAPAMPPLPTGYLATLRFEEGAPYCRLWHFLLVERGRWYRAGSGSVYEASGLRDLARRGTFEVIHPGFAWREPYTGVGSLQPADVAPAIRTEGGYTVGSPGPVYPVVGGAQTRAITREEWARLDEAMRPSRTTSNTNTPPATMHPGGFTPTQSARLRTWSDRAWTFSLDGEVEF